MTNEELISELRHDNSEMQRKIIQLESKIQIANIQIKELNKRIDIEHNIMIMGFVFMFLAILIVAVRITLNLMDCADSVKECKRHNEDLMSRKFNEISRNPSRLRELQR